MSCDCDPVGFVEIAERLGTVRGTIKTWIARGEFLEPRWQIGGRPAWNWPDVLRWAHDTGRLNADGKMRGPGRPPRAG